MLRGLGCGYIPEPMVREHLRAGRLVARRTLRPNAAARMGYAWRCGAGRRERTSLGLGLQWWLKQLAVPTTRQALLERQAA
jgi:DNA-binding transcriptional LysR family regulator